MIDLIYKVLFCTFCTFSFLSNSLGVLNLILKLLDF
jgi:hypothetical protein